MAVRRRSSQQSAPVIATNAVIPTVEAALHKLIQKIELNSKTEDVEFVNMIKNLVIDESADNDVYNYYLISNGIEVATNSQGDILRFIVEKEKEPTSKEIKVGDSLEKARVAYGDNFYERFEQDIHILGYVDKKNHESIEFWHYDNKILFYRFDDNSMD